jgi:hypothetical protein
MWKLVSLVGTQKQLKEGVLPIHMAIFGEKEELNIHHN